MSKQEKKALLVEQFLGRQDFYLSGGQLRESESSDSETDDKVRSAQQLADGDHFSLNDSSLTEGLSSLNKIMKMNQQQSHTEKKAKKKTAKSKGAEARILQHNTSEKKTRKGKGKKKKQQLRSKESIEQCKRISAACDKGDERDILLEYKRVWGYSFNDDTTNGQATADADINKLAVVFGENLNDIILSQTIQAFHHAIFLPSQDNMEGNNNKNDVCNVYVGAGSNFLLQDIFSGDSDKALHAATQTLSSLTKCSRFEFLSLGLEASVKKLVADIVKESIQRIGNSGKEDVGCDDRVDNNTEDGKSVGSGDNQIFGGASLSMAVAQMIQDGFHIVLS
uniref:Uncharacterized protein n=1 Tax=Heterosigma akashiwo TaxID=2829 RepID=A0A7S4D8N8_HETAK